MSTVTIRVYESIKRGRHRRCCTMHVALDRGYAALTNLVAAAARAPGVRAVLVVEDDVFTRWTDHGFTERKRATEGSA